MNSISMAMPVVARYQSAIVTSMPWMGSGSGSPWCVRRHVRTLAMTTPPQIHEPTTSSVAPM